MSIISSIKVSLKTDHKLCYSDGRMTVRLTLDQAAFGADYSDSMKCYVFAENHYPMCNSMQEAKTTYDWPVLTVRMGSRHIWLPGTYTLYVRDSEDSLIRASVSIDQRLRVRVGSIEECQPMGIEDTTTACLEGHDNDWHAMATTPGTVMLRQRVVEDIQLDVYNEMRKVMDSPALNFRNNLVICTINNDLTERTLAQFRCLMRCGTALKMIDCSMLFDITCNNPYEPMQEELMSVPARTTLCLTNIGALTGTGGKVIVKRLVSKIRESDEGDFPLWLCGSRQEIDAVLDMFPSLKGFFNDHSWLRQQPYTGFELVQAFNERLVKAGLVPSGNAKDQLARHVLEGAGSGLLSHWTISDIDRFVEEHVKPHFLKRTINDFDYENAMMLEPDDIELERLTEGHTAFEESIRQLEAMVGLDDLKQSITTMANRTRFYTERGRLGLKTSNKAVFHAIFTGNPGTGKTTVARQLGKIYHALGLLSRGDVIAVDRTRLVGRYIGETEENMKVLLEEARGNVLFIDEAYTLYDGAGDRKDFGGRVIDSLLTVLSQPDPDMLIIFAGYEKEMDAMLQTNPGLFGRFPYKFRFKDYTADQLMEIACRLFEQDEYVLANGARSELHKAISQTLAERTKNFGNARWLEQFVRNGIIPAVADRVSKANRQLTATDYQTIEAEDIKEAYEKFNPRTIELHPRRQIGFSA